MRSPTGQARRLFRWTASGRAIANGRDEGVTKLLFYDSPALYNRCHPERTSQVNTGHSNWTDSGSAKAYNLCHMRNHAVEFSARLHIGESTLFSRLQTSDND